MWMLCTTLIPHFPPAYPLFFYSLQQRALKELSIFNITSVLKYSTLIGNLRYGKANRSGNDYHWKDSLLLIVPKGRWMLRYQGPLGKHWEVRRQREREPLWTRALLWLPQEGTGQAQDKQASDCSSGLWGSKYCLVVWYLALGDLERG